MKLSKKIIAGAIALPILVSGVFTPLLPNVSVQAASSVSEETTVKKELSSKELENLASELNDLYVSEKLGANSNATSQGGFTTYGVKSKAVLKVAELLVKSGSKTVDILKNAGLLDAAAAKSFKRVTGKVGNFVETLASAGDSAAAMARSQLPAKLNSWGIKNKGTQEMIANSVSYAIKAADWLFL